MKAKACQRCKEQNTPVASFCIRCGLPLDQNLMIKVEEVKSKTNSVMNRLWEDPEYLEFTRKKLAELNITG